MPATASLRSFTTGFHDHFTRNPNACVYLGVSKRLDELPDPSVEEITSRVTDARRLLEQLDTLDADRDGLSFDDALDLDLARLMLESEVHRDTYTFNDRIERVQMPFGGHGIGSGIFSMFIVDPRPAGDRLADITGRIEKVPEFLDALLRCLDTPVARWVGIDREEVGGLPQLFETIQAWADKEQWPDGDRLRVARERAAAAIETYARGLDALPMTTSFHLGEATTRRLVKLQGIDLSLEELRHVATTFLAETKDTIESLRTRLARKHGLDPETPSRVLHEHLNERSRIAVEGDDFSPVLDRYRQECDRILAFIRERDLFPILADQDMKIIQTPPFMIPTIPAGAMNAPAPFRTGTRISQVFLTLTHDRLDDHNDLSIPGMMIHEGIPGHHLQLATAATHPSVIRRHVDASDHAEGWTTMLEDYMLDQGYMGDLTDEARFTGKHDLGRIGARVAIDLFFMTGDRSFLEVGVDCDLTPEDPFEAASNLLREITGFGAARSRGELNWYSTERGTPLTYLTGNVLVWALKRDVIESCGARTPPLTGLDLDREFHRIYLESGVMPVRFLREVFRHEGMLA